MNKEHKETCHQWYGCPLRECHEPCTCSESKERRCKVCGVLESKSVDSCCQYATEGGMDHQFTGFACMTKRAAPSTRETEEWSNQFVEQLARKKVGDFVDIFPYLNDKFGASAIGNIAKYLKSAYISLASLAYTQGRQEGVDYAFDILSKAFSKDKEFSMTPKDLDQMVDNIVKSKRSK